MIRLLRGLGRGLGIIFGVFSVAALMGLTTGLGIMIGAEGLFGARLSLPFAASIVPVGRGMWVHFAIMRERHGGVIDLAAFAWNWPLQGALVFAWITVAYVVRRWRKRRPHGDEVTITCSDSTFNGTYVRKR